MMSVHDTIALTQIIELENFKKAKILKKYAKLCAEEGIASERVNVPGRPDSGSSGSCGSSGSSGSGGGGGGGGGDIAGGGGGKKKTKDTSTSTANRGGRRLDSLQKAQLQFKKKKEASANARRDDEEVMAESGKNPHASAGGHLKKRPKRVHAETKRGQPVMKNQISRMLETLQQQQQ